MRFASVLTVDQLVSCCDSFMVARLEQLCSKGKRGGESIPIELPESDAAAINLVRLGIAEVNASAPTWRRATPLGRRVLARLREAIRP
jgi:hypothetical protein